MKKLLLIPAFMVCLLTSSFASNYKVDEANVDQLFASSEDVTLTAADEAYSLMNTTSSIKAEGEKTVGGFLVRAFFCGGFALHRYYMGTDGKQLFWYYFCIPVMGGVAGCVDFWWVVFKGKEAMDKYTNNGKFLVWAD
jgi:hypothetical protein